VIEHHEPDVRVMRESHQCRRHSLVVAAVFARVGARHHVRWAAGQDPRDPSHSHHTTTTTTTPIHCTIVRWATG